MDEGHCGLPVAELVPLAERLLEVTQDLIRTALDLELQDGAVIADRIGETDCVTTNLYFSNLQFQPATYDLTSNTFSHVNQIQNIYGFGNLTLLINSADAAGINSFISGGMNDTLVTAASTLDLSHTTVGGFTVASTNAQGTTFTVGDLGTALQIAGGPGQDTLVAPGFTLTAVAL